MTKSKKNIDKIIQRRATVLYLLVAFFGVAILVQVFRLQVIQREKWITIQEESSYKKVIQPKRGDILSNKGNLLATSIPWYDVTIDMRTPGWDKYLNPAFNITAKNQQQFDSLCVKLKEFMPGYTAYQIKVLIKSKYNKRKQVYLDKNLDYNELQRLRNFPVLREGKYKTGLVYHQHMKRVKPYGTLAARSIGNINHKGRGYVGLESAFNADLSGKEGETTMQKLAGGYWVPVDDELQAAPQTGYDLITTIDVNLQDIVHNALLRQLKIKKADHGCAVLMEVETGNVLAISNLVDTLNGYHEFYNYAVGESTEPGSTMKLASLMAAIEDGYIDLDDSVDTGDGKIEIAGLTIRDSDIEEKGGYGKLSVKEVFKYSSNVGVVKLIQKHYSENPQKFIDRLCRMNVDKKLGIEIPGEPRPLIKSTNDSLWWQGSLAQISYGYESLLTPLQTLTFYNAVANDGKMVRPRFVKAIGKDGKIIETLDKEIIDHSICSRSTIRQAKEMLESVVDNEEMIATTGRTLKGTGFNLVNDDFKIAGKTGTSQIARGRSGYQDASGKKLYQASFVGYYPADEPKYSCIVVINSPTRGGYYGNIIAGKVFKEIARKVYSLDLELNQNNFTETHIAETPTSENGFRKDLELIFENYDIPVLANDLKSDWILTYNKDSVVECKNRFIKEGQYVPNVIGMGLKDALYILENKGLRVSVRGVGTVRRQNPGPQDPFRKGDRILLELS